MTPATVSAPTLSRPTDRTIERAEQPLCAGQQPVLWDEVDELLDRVSEAAGDWSCSVIDQAVAAVGARLGTFSANDVRGLLPAVPSPTIGARFTALSRAGRIRPIGYVTSSSPTTHHRPIRLWRWVK